MSENDGLRKLSEYLHQTKRQAEHAVDILNTKITELQLENDKYASSIMKIEKERNYFMEYAEQLKSENATKWKLRERDEGKSLVDSIQQDRNRLQDECILLTAELEKSRFEVSNLQSELHSLRSQMVELSENERSTIISSTPTKVCNEARNISCDTDHPSADSTSSRNLLPLSPLLDRAGNEVKLPDSPNALAKHLKAELRRAQSQLDYEKKTAEANLAAQAIEISRLKQELDVIGRTSTGDEAQGDDVSSHHYRRHGDSDRHHLRKSDTVVSWIVPSSWLGLLFGISGNTASSSSPHYVGGADDIQFMSSSSDRWSRGGKNTASKVLLV